MGAKEFEIFKIFSSKKFEITCAGSVLSCMKREKGLGFLSVDANENFSQCQLFLRFFFVAFFFF